MPVDRVFSLAGHGTLVTGAVHGGIAAVGEHLQLMPPLTCAYAASTRRTRPANTPWPGSAAR